METITRDDFTKAVSAAVAKTIDEVREKYDNPMASFLIPMAGVVFSHAIEDALFGDDEESEKEEPKQEGTENGEE